MSALMLNFIICSAFSILSILYYRHQKNKLISHMRAQVEKALILQEMLEIEAEYFKILNEKSAVAKQLKRCDKVNEYLKNNTHLLNKMNYDIDLSRIIIQEGSINDKEFKVFLSQLDQCSKEIKELVLRKQNVTIRVVKLKRPRYYAFKMMSNKAYLKAMYYGVNTLIILLESIIKVVTAIDYAGKIKDNLVRRIEGWKNSDILIDRNNNVLKVSR